VPAVAPWAARCSNGVGVLLQNVLVRAWTVDDFLELETAVWQALTAGDAEADARLLSADFVGVYPSGVADHAGHVGQLANGATVAEFALSEVQVITVSATAALLVYRADFRRPRSTSAEVMYVSSLWCRRHGRWVNVFSQDTPAGDENGPA
jgi:hypothetical protein